METILNELDKQLQDTFKNKGLKAYGFCELISKDGKPNPTTCDRDRKVAAIHDRFNGIFYHRIAGNNPIKEDEEFSFGVDMAIRNSVRIITVLAFKTTLGEDFIFEFVKAIPRRITTLTDYKFVFLSAGTLIADHEAVYNQEYGQNSYEKHRTSWNIYSLEYDIDFILC